MNISDSPNKKSGRPVKTTTTDFSGPCKTLGVVKVTAELSKKLDRKAFDLETTKSDIINIALSKYFAEEDAQALCPPQQAPSGVIQAPLGQTPGLVGKTVSTSVPVVLGTTGGPQPATFDSTKGPQPVQYSNPKEDFSISDDMFKDILGKNG